MKIKQVAGVAVCSTAMFSFCAIAPASAINNIKAFGVQETLTDFNSNIGYTVKGLRPSTDVIPYPVAGRLYEATVTADAVQGTVTPIIPFFNARAESGANYRVLSDVFTPQGLSGAPLPQGASSTGKLYFDVVGDVPNSVVYNNGFEDQLGWVNGPPLSGAEVSGGSSSDGNSTNDNTTNDNDTGGGNTEVPGSTGPNLVTPPAVSGGTQNGPYGPAGDVPPVGGR